MRVSVQEERFELGVEAEAFIQANKISGAIVTFTGVVRDADQG